MTQINPFSFVIEHGLLSAPEWTKYSNYHITDQVSIVHKTCYA
jgi:hypothetical protein